MATLAPTESTTFTITFKPTSAGKKSATVTIANNTDNQNLYTFTISGTGVIVENAPKIVVRQLNDIIPNVVGIFDFGAVGIGFPSPAVEFTIANVGSIDLNLTGRPDMILKSGVDADLFAIDQSLTVSPVKSGSTTTFSVTFTPIDEGVKSATIEIPNNDADENPYTFTITGTGAYPEFVVKQGSEIIPADTGSFDFGNVDNKASSNAITFTIENIGNCDLNLTGSPKIQKSGSDAAMFNIDQGSTISRIPKGESTTFSIVFSPTSVGVKTTTISIPNNNANKNPYTFLVTGTSVPAPEINVKQGTTNIPCTTGSYDFGATKINYVNFGIIFTIENLGTADLLLTGNPIVNITGTNANQFSAITSSTLTTIPPSESTTFTIIFNPSSVGNKSATVSIPNNDRDENPYTFNILGEGIETMYCWTKRMGGTSGDVGLSVTTDPSGNIFIVGYFRDTVDFGADFGVSDSKTSIIRDNFDIFITKVNANATYGWTKRMGGSGHDYANSVTTDASGNIYLTGSFKGTVDFGADFGVSDTKTSNAYVPNFFVSKINAIGTYGWTKHIGGSYFDDVVGNSIDTDNSGNVFLTGVFRGTVNFGADFGVTDNKTSAGGSDIFVTKINANGNYGWTKIMGGTNGEIGQSLTLDVSGNIYITGLFQGTVNFAADFGSNDNKTSAGSTDIYITKINANGTYGWTKRMGGTGSDRGYSITTDNSGNVYLTGIFQETVDFGADFGVSDSNTSAGGYDIFVTKINSNGTYGWTKKIGDTNNDYSNSITTDETGNVYLTGYFQGSIDFGADFGISDSKTSAGGNDIFVTKINSSGTYGWTKRMGGTSHSDNGYSITTDTSGNIYLTGRFQGTVDFGSDFGISDSKTSAGSTDIFITKLSQ